jgi:hypothetical protein
MLPLYTQTFLSPAEEVLIYTLKLFCRNIWNFPMNIFFYSSSVRELLLQTRSFKQPQRKKSQGLRSGERAGQMPLLIILSPETSDKAFIDIRAVWAVSESCLNQSYGLSSSS